MSATLTLADVEIKARKLADEYGWTLEEAFQMLDDGMLDDSIIGTELRMVRTLADRIM